ncbi:MAG: aspartate aminotransferase family protein [Theionarchaea archaeon]|nr:aspartate aminotransferase family protein [Theionarchaea archaeon]
MSYVLRCSGYKLCIPDIVRAQGCYLFDSHNKKYVDFEAGVWCTSVGHNNSRVNQAIINQLETVAHTGYRVTHSVVEEAAYAVLDTLAIPDGKCVFLSSGSEAVELGVTTLRRSVTAPLLLTFSNSYLAAYGSAGRKNAEEWYCCDWSVCTGCLHPHMCMECDLVKEIPLDTIGGLVIEPGCTGGLIKFPPENLVETLVHLVRKEQGLVLVDEVTTGVGRTGRMYGFQHYSFRPDIVALGKGLGNGYPVSAVAMTPEVSRRLEDSSFRYAQSHQNDPLGCAVAREVLAIIQEEQLVERSNEVGRYFLEHLEHVVGQRDMVKEVRGRGLMLAIEFKDDTSFSLESAFLELLEAGFIVGYKPEAALLRFLPPLTIEETDISRLLQELGCILDRYHKV